MAVPREASASFYLKVICVTLRALFCDVGMRQVNRSFLLCRLSALLVFCSLPFITSANPLNSYYCIAHHGTIHLGDPTTKVKAACGEPSQINPVSPGGSQGNARQVVTYRLVQTNSTSPQAGRQRSAFAHPGGAKPEVVIELENNTIKTIRVGDKRKQKTRACGGFIQQGDSAKRLVRRCGKPASAQWVHKTPETLNHQQEWIYHLGDYAQALKLQFTGGRLSRIYFGAMGEGQ